MKLSDILSAVTGRVPKRCSGAIIPDMRRPFLDLVTGEVFLDLESLRLAQPGAFLVPVSWDDPDLNPADPATWAGYMEKHCRPNNKISNAAMVKK